MTRSYYKRLFLYVLLILTSYYLKAQDGDEVKSCGTMEYLDIRLKQNPELEQKLKNLENYTKEWIDNHTNDLESIKDVIVIPVVVHIVYNKPEENISDAQVLTQIEVLNQDYRRMNTDASNTPSFFAPVAADCQIEFCLAKRTPDDSATSGIIRTFTTVESFTLDNKVKFDSTGGSNAWDCDKYLNLWVCNMGGGYLGYASWPGDDPEVDGVVIRYQSFGKYGSAQPPYHMGRTCTHEVGHWLNLFHPWGNWGGCNDDDYVSDTPLQDGPHYFCPSYPQPSCTDTSDMFMNYMDYVNDSCMNLFTQGQKARMMAVMDIVRAPLKDSDGCKPVGIGEISKLQSFQIFPNPSTGMVNIIPDRTANENIILTVHDLLGKMIIKSEIQATDNKVHIIDLSNKPSGFYFLRISTQEEVRIERIFIINWH